LLGFISPPASFVSPDIYVDHNDKNMYKMYFIINIIIVVVIVIESYIKMKKNEKMK